MKTLTEKAMLARLSISNWTARKLDKAITQEVADAHNTTTDAGSYRKALIGKEALEEIARVSNTARTYHRENTLPWHDDGARILPAANFMEYSQRMRAFESDHDCAVLDFLREYPALIQSAAIRLNGLFNAMDYPTDWELREKYSFGVAIDPMPDGADFRVQLQGGELDRIRAEITQRGELATRAAMRDLWDRLHDAVSHMADRLSAFNPDGKGKDRGAFRDSLVSNLAELTELLPRLNLTNDPDLERMRQQVEHKLCASSADTLREDTSRRAAVATCAETILERMAGYMDAGKGVA